MQLLCSLFPLLAAGAELINGGLWGGSLWGAQKPLRPVAVSRRQFDALDELARLTDIAYCVPLPGIAAPFACASRCHEFPSAELITSFTAPPVPVPLLDSSATGFVAFDHDAVAPRLLVVFRGTYSLADVVSDLATLPQPYTAYPGDGDDDAVGNATACANCTVHAGFYASYRATRERLIPCILSALAQRPSYRLTITGHSLGGAIALLTALELRGRGLDVALTTFGQPAVGNLAFAKHVDNVLSGRSAVDGLPVFQRITHRGDPVPSLPWQSWGYVQPAAELFVDKAALPATEFDLVVCNGRSDARCSAGQWPAGRWPLDLWPWDYVTAHRDYFHRLGLCVATDSQASATSESPAEWRLQGTQT